LETGTNTPRKLSTPARIALGLVVGVVLGLFARAITGHDFAPAGPGGFEVRAAEMLDWTLANVAMPLGGIFLNMMFMMIVPLVFSSLALGVAGLGDIKAVGKLGLRVLVGTILLTSASVAIGLGLVNTVKPGQGLDPETARETAFGNFDQRRGPEPPAREGRQELRRDRRHVRAAQSAGGHGEPLQPEPELQGRGHHRVPGLRRLLWRGADPHFTERGRTADPVLWRGSKPSACASSNSRCGSRRLAWPR
jgi:hypothetical protein